MGDLFEEHRPRARMALSDRTRGRRCRARVETPGGWFGEHNLLGNWRKELILQIAADEFWVLGISRPGPGYQPYNVRLGNQPETRIDGWAEGVQKITYPEQWYIVE